MAKTKVLDADFLEGKYTNGRRLLSIIDLNDLRSKEGNLKKAIKDWLSQVEK